MCVDIIVTGLQSLNVGRLHVAFASQLLSAEADTVEGHEVNTGFDPSVIVTVKAHVAEFPEASVAVYVTSVLPAAKIVPGVCEDVIVTRQLSFALGGVHETGALQLSVA